MRYRILDSEGILIGKAGSLRKADQFAAAYEKKHSYASRDHLARRYCFIEVAGR